MHVNLGDVRRCPFNSIFAVLFLWALSTVSCSHENTKSSAHPPAQEEPRGDGTAAPASAEPATADRRPVLVAFGDSLTAGVVPHSYPEYLQGILDAHSYRYRVDNQGVSGDTTTDGLARIGNVIAAHPALVILEFGGNDGLRGTPVDATKSNLESMVSQLQAANVPVVLAGITLPPNYGPDYVKPFTAMFSEVAKKFHIHLLPFLLIDVYQHPEMMQPDGIHPNEKGNQVLAQDVFGFIRPFLKRSSSSAQ